MAFEDMERAGGRDPGAAEPREGTPGGHADPPGIVGSTLSHYRIIASIGRGGMGVVYKAADTRLDRTVALKFLPPLLGDDVGANRRFITEARAASALDHPNICTIYDIGQIESGQTYIAMAYYDGETLKEKIARGPLPVDEALDYATQLARGLSKAHQAGIVHRDMKPANVIITSDGVAKILDFGLAKVEDQQLTRTGELLGTLDYMSPEQMQGGHVDRPSDVWSLGTMLFEMLTGGRPFSGANQAAVLYSVIHEEPPPVTESNPSVPAHLAGVVKACLEKDPSRRFADAGALLEALGERRPAKLRGVEAGRPRPAARATAVDRPRLRLGRRVGLGAGVGALGLLLALPSGREAVTGVFGARPAMARTYLAVIPSSGGNQEDNILAEGLTHSLTGMVTRLGADQDSLWVIPATEILNQEVRSSSQARDRFQVNTVVTVAIQRVGTDARVVLSLVDPDPGRTVRTLELPMPDAPDFQDEAPKALASLLNIRPKPGSMAGLGAPATPQAYDFYVQGLGYLRRYDIENNLDQAEILFEQALDEDSLYAPAHAGLCETLWEQYRRASDTRLARTAITRCDRARALAAEQVEVLVPIARVYLETGENARAERTLERALEIDSTNADAHRWMARVHDAEGRDDPARASYERAINLDPGQWIYHNELATFLVYRGHAEAAAPHFEQVRRLTPNNYLGDIGLAFTYQVRNDLESARRYYTASLDKRETELAYRNLGYLDLREGRWAEAITKLERARALDDGSWWLWRWMGEARFWNGEREQATEAWRRMVRLVEPRLEVNPHDEDLLAGAAEAHAHLGDTERAGQLLGRLLDEPLKWNYIVYYAGRVHELLGDREGALAYVERAMSEGYDPASVERDPWLRDLRRDPRFRRIDARRR